MKKLIAICLTTGIIGSTFAINCERNVVSVTAGEMKIEITISKNDISGFARLSETLPAGSEIKYAKTEGGVFNFEDNKLKFFWMKLPKDKEIKVSYTISTSGMLQGNQNIGGRFSYVVDGNTVIYNLPVTSFLINDKKEALLENATASIAKTEPAIISKTETAVITKTKTEAKKMISKKLVYKIQIASSKEKLSSDRFAKYNFSQPVQTMDVTGGIKYTTGEFTTLDEAVKYKQEVSGKGADGAFILPLLDGKVISIAEAKELEGATK